MLIQSVPRPNHQEIATAHGGDHGRAADGTPLLKCVGCWVELKLGHTVSLRLLPELYAGNLTVGQTGIVQSIFENDKTEISVKFGNMQTVFKREELSYVVGQPPLPLTPGASK